MDSEKTREHPRCAAIVSNLVTSVEDRFFCWLGRQIGRRPVVAACLSCLVYLALTPGVFLLEGDGNVVGLRMDTDFLTTFTLEDTQEYLDYMHATGIFPDTHNVGIVETPRHGRDLLSASTLRAALAVEARVATQISARHEKRDVVFQDVCARSRAGAPCRYFSAASAFLGTGPAAEVRLQELEGMEANASHTATSRALWLMQGLPPHLRGLLQALVGAGSTAAFPGAAASDEALVAWLLTGRALAARFDLVNSKAGKAFQAEAVRVVAEDAQTPELRASSISTTTLGDECVKIGSSAIPLLVFAVVLMATYVLAFLGSETRCGSDTQLLLLLVGVSVPGMSSLSAFGLMGYVGLKLNVLALMAPFLGLAVGVDAVFLVITSINSVPPEEQDPSEVMSRAVSRAGVAATTTTFTSVTAFVVSAATSTNFPGMFAFNMLLVFILILNWVGMLVLLPACTVLNEQRIAARRWDLLPFLKRKDQGASPEDFEQVGGCSGLLRRVGLGRRVRGLVSEGLAPLVESSLPCQLAGSAVWLGLLAAGIALVPNLGKGMPDRYFVTDSSPVNIYFDDAEAAFGKVSGVGIGILFEQPRLGSRAYRETLLNFTSALQGRADAAGPLQCWPALVASQLPSQAGDAEAAAQVLGFFSDNVAGAAYAWDAQLDGGGGVKAARCHFATWQPSDAKLRAAQTEEIRSLASGAGLSAMAYHISFPTSVSRYNAIQRLVVLSAVYACVAVLGTLLLVLPVHLALLAVGNVVAVVLVLFGFMVAVDITCNAISLTVVLMAIGFCVDYSCHVVHFADHGVSPGTPWCRRMGHSLRECGFDVFQGCATAFLGVAMLGFNAAVAFRIFTAMSLVITGIGGTFALWGLPSLLALSSRTVGGTKVLPADLPRYTADETA